MDIENPEPSMQLLAEAAETQPPAPVPDAAGADEDDSRSSSLSDIEDGPATDISDANEELGGASEDEDTEAETERLEPSPEKHRRLRKVVLSADPETNEGSVVDADGIDPPVTRARGKTENINLEDGEQDDDANIPTSDISSPAESPELSDQEDTEKPASRKRKREDDDNTAKSLKKVALELANHVADEADAADDIGSPEGSADGNEDAALEDEEGFRNDDQGEEQVDDEQGNGDTQEAVEGADSNAEEVEGDEGNHDTASAARTQEELEKRKAALDSLSGIERDFALLRDKLFADRSTQLSQELATIDTDNPTHPLYLSVLTWLNQLREEKLEQAKTLFSYKFAALQKRSVSNRASLQSQYMQRIRELRDETLERASADWYQIQRERRNLDVDKETPLKHFGGDRIQWITGQTAYNTEVSILSGLSKYVGFPAAPEILGARSSDVEEDLRKMGIARPPPPATNPAGSTRPKQKLAAEEQFIADTPWANPQHQHSQFLTSIHRQIGNGVRPTSPVNTPIGQKQSEPVPNGSASTIPALPTSSLAPTPMSGEASGVKAKQPENNPDYTPSRQPERSQPANADHGPKDAAAGPSTAVGSTAADKSSRDTAKAQQNGGSPMLPAAQSLKDAAPMSSQFSPSGGPPPVQVGSL